MTCVVVSQWEKRIWRVPCVQAYICERQLEWLEVTIRAQYTSGSYFDSWRGLTSKKRVAESEGFARKVQDIGRQIQIKHDTRWKWGYCILGTVKKSDREWRDREGSVKKVRGAAVFGKGKQLFVLQRCKSYDRNGARGQ